MFGIAGSQGTLPFIDVTVDGDVELFIDPAAIAALESPWANACTAAVRSYFQAVLDLITSGDPVGARGLLSFLGEDNSTHLGMSATSRGSGVGPELARRFYKELSTSIAVQTGLITDLEDTALLIEGVREDRISDVVTNVIRKQLVEFTQLCANFYGMPLQPGVAVGSYWDTPTKAWRQQTFALPVTPHGPLLLVPKAIVRKSLFLSPDEYYRHYVLEYFRLKELNDPGSNLVYLIKGQPRVRKADVEAKVRNRHRTGKPGIEKRVNVDATQQDPSILASYKAKKRRSPPAPLSHEEISEAAGVPEPDLKVLLDAVVKIKPGKAESTKYERAVEALLSAALYPDLVNPIPQEQIHNNRKRIDISYTNAAQPGSFFNWVATHYPAANVVAECKNYSRSLANPEYDQIAGRFSPSRGKVGLLVYRKIDDKQQVLKSCHDTAADDRGFIIALDDDDLTKLVAEAMATGSCAAIGGLLHKRFKALIN